MNARDLKGLVVVALSDADKVGHVDDVLFDGQYRRVLGFRVKRGAFGGTESVLRRDVSAIGQDAITIPSRAALNDEKRFPEMVGASTLGQVEGTHVVTEGGTRLGSIRAVRLDNDARNVVEYELDRSFLERLRGEQPVLDARHVQRIGERGIMIVANAALPAEGEEEQPTQVTAEGAEAQPARPRLNPAQGAGLANGGQPMRQAGDAYPPNVAAGQQPGTREPGTRQPGMGADVARGGTAPLPPREGPVGQLGQPAHTQQEPPPGLMRPGIANPAVNAEPQPRSGMGEQRSQPPMRPPEGEQQPPAGA